MERKIKATYEAVAQAAARDVQVRWLPPIPANIEDYDALPAVIRPVTPPTRLENLA